MYKENNNAFSIDWYKNVDSQRRQASISIDMVWKQVQVIAFSKKMLIVQWI